MFKVKDFLRSRALHLKYRKKKAAINKIKRAFKKHLEKRRPIDISAAALVIKRVWLNYMSRKEAKKMRSEL